MTLEGHTPGHTGYIIESKGERLLIWGDIVHFPDVQVARPEVTVAFDNDSNEAASARRQILDRVSAENLLVGGMQLTEPSYVRIERKGASFQLVRERWSTTLV